MRLSYGSRFRPILIGHPRCISVSPIEIRFGYCGDRIIVEDTGEIARSSHLDSFAKQDGFEDWEDMRRFWRNVHDVSVFNGFLIRWEPIRRANNE